MPRVARSKRGLPPATPGTYAGKGTAAQQAAAKEWLQQQRVGAKYARRSAAKNPGRTFRNTPNQPGVVTTQRGYAGGGKVAPKSTGKAKK